MNMQDDPKYLAFALGELEGDALATMTEEVDADPELRKVVEEYRRLGRLISQEYAAEVSPSLTRAQHEALEREISGKSSSAPVPLRRALGRRFPEPKQMAWFRMCSAIAASIVIIGLLIAIASHHSTAPVEIVAPNPPTDTDLPVLPPPMYIPTPLQPQMMGTPKAPADPTREDPPIMIQERDEGRRSGVKEDAFLPTRSYPLSCFSLNVDTAAYLMVQQQLTHNYLPHAHSVRLEEMVNYFIYDYPEPEGAAPFSLTAQIAACPWNTRHRLVRIGVKGRAGHAGTIIARDVRIQLTFNREKVKAYSLLGYEDRMLRTEDFNDDGEGARQIRAGHTVTALYELVPQGVDDVVLPAVDERPTPPPALQESMVDGVVTVRLRYKLPTQSVSTSMEVPLIDAGRSYLACDADFKFSAAVAAFAMLLRDSDYRGTATYAGVLELADAGKGSDPEGQRSEFLELVRKAKSLTGAE